MTAAEQWAQVRKLDVQAALSLGPNTLDRWICDPKRLAFMLERYIFAAKMIADCKSILECGCGDGFGTVTFLQDTKASIHGIDFDGELIQYANNVLLPTVLTARKDGHRLFFSHEDIFQYSGPQVEAVVSLDVWEHMPPEASQMFVHKIASFLLSGGMAVIGTPSKLASQYASDHSNLGHSNLLDPERFKKELQDGFRRVIPMAMNDGSVGARFMPMSHYLLAVCHL